MVADLVERFERDRKVSLSTGLSVRHSTFVVRNSSGVFLGKVIRLTAGHQAKIEEKPEVRKAGGVYYTPRSSGVAGVPGLATGASRRRMQQVR
jgi:hypothetical protein